ncbi:MAG: hypothetical protein JWM74_4496 [Myxococcaceae bacterium]|nr:hypothetical protein [Myxococcaceae bacterium]
MASLTKPTGLALLALSLGACRPGYERASKSAGDYNERTRNAAIAQLEADTSLAPFTPRDVLVPAKAVAVPDAWLQGCLFEVDGELGFQEARCREKNGSRYDVRYYKSGSKVVLARIGTEVLDESYYDDAQCLQSGLHGGADMSRMAMPREAEDVGPPPIPLKMLAVRSATDVVVREVRYRVKVVAKTCTGTYETLGYPP